MPRPRKHTLPTLKQASEAGWSLKVSPPVNSRSFAQLLATTFPSTSLASRQALVRSLYGPPATKMMVCAQSVLEVTSNSTVKLSVTVELTPPFKRKRKPPLQPPQFEGVNELLSTMLKLQQLQQGSSWDGQALTEGWDNGGRPGPDRQLDLAPGV